MNNSSCAQWWNTGSLISIPVMATWIHVWKTEEFLFFKMWHGIIAWWHQCVINIKMTFLMHAIKVPYAFTSHQKRPYLTFSGSSFILQDQYKIRRIAGVLDLKVRLLDSHRMGYILVAMMFICRYTSLKTFVFVLNIQTCMVRSGSGSEHCLPVFRHISR